MSLSTWEQQALDSIKDELAGSDPELTALLTTFSQLAADEEMPARVTLRARSRRAVQSSRQKRRRTSQAYQRLYLRYALLVWFVMTATIIGAAVTLSRGNVQSACPRSWWAACANQASSSGTPFTAQTVPAAHLPR
ncbi:MAG TPA: hypothetical protein VGI96_33895 [Streptosporangiaceae bacterium]|jgi:hypothetical protein